MSPKKREAKKRKSPCTPYREKAKGKEISPGANRTGLSRACARALRCNPRLLNSAAVANAMEAFRGSASDELVWGRIVWRIGAANFVDAIIQAEAEIREHARPVPVSQHPRIFQAVLNKRFPKGGAR